jgi:hypothetical protein
VQYPNNAEKVGQEQIVDPDILEVFDGPRAQADKSGSSEMPRRADMGHVKELFDRIIDSVKKPESYIRGVLCHKIISELADDIIPCRRPNDTTCFTTVFQLCASRQSGALRS